MAPPGAFVSEHEWPALKRAARRDLYRLIPGLAELKGSIPGIGTQAIGDQDHLTVSLVAIPQMSLPLHSNRESLGRVVELEHTAVDQAVVRDSLQLTQDLLAQSGEGLPEALAELLQRFSSTERRHAANRLRRELGRRYVISVFDEPEVVALPELQPTGLEPEERSISLIVSEMEGRRSVKADHLQDVTDTTDTERV